MRLQFNQAVHLVKAPGHPAKDYKVGVHEVPSAVLKANHARIEKFIKAGWIIEGEAVKKVVSNESPKERQLRLAEKLGIDVSKEKAALAAASKKDEEAPAEEDSEAESDAESEVSDEAESSNEESDEAESEEMEESEEAPAEEDSEAESEAAPSNKSKKKKKKK